MAVNLQQDTNDTLQDAIDPCTHSTQLSHSTKKAELRHE